VADRLVDVVDGFWNIRGSFRIAVVLDIGTQASLVRLASGRFVLLGGYTLAGAVRDRVWALTDGGAAIDAVIHLHPFHTVHVAPLHAQLPHAALYGTARHVRRAPDLPWQELRAEDPAMNELFDGELAFTVPDGLHLVPEDGRVHASSVLALHRPSRALHVDDTLTYVGLPLIGGLAFHPTVSRALEQRAGAAVAFQAWAEGLIAMCDGVDHLCTAHLRPLPPIEGSPAIAAAIRKALTKLEPALRTHAARWG
jgi:hypothetical protein